MSQTECVHWINNVDLRQTIPFTLTTLNEQRRLIWSLNVRLPGIITQDARANFRGESAGPPMLESARRVACVR